MLPVPRSGRACLDVACIGCGGEVSAVCLAPARSPCKRGRGRVGVARPYDHQRCSISQRATHPVLTSATTASVVTKASATRRAADVELDYEAVMASQEGLLQGSGGE